MQSPTAPRFTLSQRSQTLQWTCLLAVTAGLVPLLLLMRLSAALLLGSLLAAIVVSAMDAQLEIPEWPYRFAQGVVGCLIARSINIGIFEELVARWPIFLSSIVSVIVVSTLLGALLARYRVLPGTTAVWGSAPGAATVMTLMSEAFGGDVRLVAFMQFLRVVLVAVVASVVTRITRMLTGTAAVGSNAFDMSGWFPAVPLVPASISLAIALGGTVLGSVLKVPAGPLLVPMVLAAVVGNLHWVEITLPSWLLGASYVLVGWALGLRFTRDILIYAARVLPQVAGSILTLIALCGGLAYVLHRVTGKDMLTAYLATSPGGADSVAIIAASSKVDVPFVMAMQVGRFLLVLLIGPSVARFTAAWIARSEVSASAPSANADDAQPRSP